MPTTDCDCYHELINMKETFKRKCFGKNNSGLSKHLRCWLPWSDQTNNQSLHKIRE